uniref:protein mono-ADP-ribosyltransferase PARP12 n=1 Tax=Semicossyphus pulcher TaxID=241346 RepID=UPI0037E79395
MATAYYDSEAQQQSLTDSDSESDASEESDSDESSESDSQVSDTKPCKYYNSGGCRDGKRCLYLHVCKYALKGNCQYGSKCKLNHPRGRSSSKSKFRVACRSKSTGPTMTDGRLYQWQLNDGNNWMDIINDHIIEAQYSLPHTKSIKIYNTLYGAVSIDFNRLRVCGKNLRVRRLDDGNTVWIWFCTLGRKWIKYGDKDSKGNLGPVKSSDIEMKFQTNPTSSYTFNIGAETFEIRFREMRQVGQNGKRKVTRRPMYRHPQAAAAGVCQASSALQTLSLGTKPQWQFEGDSGAWHSFKQRRGSSAGCSVSTEDIEKKYQLNQSDTINFKVNGHSYKLDLGAMTQTNLKTKNTRRIRRVLV